MNTMKIYGMKIYKFLIKWKYVYIMAETILKAKKWMQYRYGEYKFITIEKVCHGSKN